MPVANEIRMVIMKRLSGQHGAGNCRIVCPLLAVLTLAACHSTGPVKPSIEVTTVPVSSIGGPDEMNEIAGKVHNASMGQQVVL